MQEARIIGRRTVLGDHVLHISVKTEAFKQGRDIVFEGRPELATIGRETL
jgi:hypothetical protein